MKKLLPLLIISFLAWLPTTDAQLTITGEDAVVCDNGAVSIDVSVSNFIDITSAQFGVTWDPAVIQFVSASNNLPAPTLFNTTNAPTGELRFSWFDANPPPGYTPPGPPAGSQIIFTINFNIVGNYSTDNFTDIVFGSVPGFSMEIASTSGIIPNGSIVINPGSVMLDDVTPPSITCPADVTVTAAVGQPSAVVNYTAPTVTDNCDNPAMAAVCSPVSGSGFVIGTTTVNCTATDGAGNSSNCSFSVTVNPPPANPNALVIAADDFEITCNDTVVSVPVRVENFIQMTSAQFALIWDEMVLEYTGFTDSINANGNNTALYNFANAPMGEFRFSWFDSDGVPGEDLPDSSVIFTLHFKVLDENELPDTVVITGVPGFNIEFSDTSGILGPGDYAFGDAVISVTPDTIPPSITCPADQTIYADANCEATLPDYTSMATVTDNCSDPMDIVITQTPASGTVVTDTTEIMLIATDEAGLMDTCYFEVNFVDSLLPTIACPANDTLDVDSAACFAMLMLPAATAMDNCGILSLTDDGPTNGEFPVGSTTVTFTATDVNGNEATCQTVVVVNDTIPPIITCPADILQSTDAGDCTAVVTWADPTVDDNCTNVTITCIPPSGTTFPIGDSTVVCIVEDPGGNLDTCTFVVTVFDGEAPTLQCPADTLITVPLGTVDTVINDIYLFFIGDNCGLDTSYYHFSGAIPSGGGTGSDASGTAFPVGTTTVTYYGVDDMGNIDSCSFDVTIEEELILTITCSPDQVVDNDPGICGALVTGVTADAQPPANVQTSLFQKSGATIGNGVGLDASGSYNSGVTTVTFIAISPTNDTVSCSTTVTVNDAESPVFTNCPTDTVTMGNTIDVCGLVFSGSVVPVATDNCPGLTLNYNFGVDSLIPLGFNTITATATDGAGNSTTCEYVLEVIDNQPPKFLNCSNGSTITMDNDPGQCGAVVSWSPVVTAQDNCMLLALSETSPGNGDFFPVGNTTVTYTAVDDKGNVSTCEINVTIVDNQPPAIVCPGNQPPVNTDLNMCSAEVNFPAPTASDNCAVVSFGPTTPVGPVFDEGVHTLNYEATDAAGNTTTCTFTVTVVDNQFPFIPNMPADITVYTAASDCGAIVTWSPPNFPIDNCGIDTFGPSGGDPGDFFGVGAHEVKYVAMDINGNVTVETLNITVIDTIPPAINCPAGVSITVDGMTADDPDGFLTSSQQVDCDNIILDYAALMATDACGIGSFMQTAGLPSGSQFPIGATTMTFQATDNYGNANTCSFIVNVIDLQIAPATVSQGLVCEGGTVTFSVGTYPGATYTWTTGNTVVSNDPVFTIANAELNQSGIYTVVVSTAFCDVQFTTELNVSAVPVVSIEANDIFCATNGLPLTLNGVNTSSANVNSWVWTFPGGAMPTGQMQVIQNPDVNDSGNYCVTASTIFGCSATACEQIDVNTGPPTPVVNGTTASYCIGSPDFTLFGQLYSGSNVSYHWYAEPNAGSGLISVNNPITQVHPTLPNTYHYYFYVTVDGCVSDTAEWVVVVEAAPTINLAVTGQTQCVDGNSDVTLTDNGTGAVSWSWSGTPFGTLPGNTNSVVLQNVTANFTGTYTVVASSTIGCTSSSSVQLTFTNAPSPAPQLTVSDPTICEGTPFVTLTGTQYSGTVDYIWIGSGIPPNSQNNNVIDVIPSTPGTYDYSFAALVNGCYTDTVTQTITVVPAPVFDIVVTGDVNCVDGTSPITLSTSASGLTDFEWTNGVTTLSNASSLVLMNANSSLSGTYYLTATSQGCEGYGQTTLNISDAVDGLTATSTMIDCELQAVTLEASAIANASYAWFLPNAQLFATTQNTTLNNANDGTYTVVAQVNGCTDTATVEVDLPNTLDANDKLVLCTVDVPQEFNILAMDVYEAGQPFTITILQEPTNGTVEYVDNDSIYRYTPNPGFWGNDLIIYEICYTGCTGLCDIATVTFEVNYPIDECVITTVISPNDDGYNDEFIVSCIEGGTYPLNTLHIFNQWGTQVYEAAPYNNDWKGTYDGKDLPDGTYFFIFQRDPDTPAQKGFVMIYR